MIENPEGRKRVTQWMLDKGRIGQFILTEETEGVIPKERQ